MNGFQVVGISGCALMALLTLTRIVRESERLRLVAWLMLWVAAAVCIANPRLLQQLANLLGINRGADLLGSSCGELQLLQGLANGDEVLALGLGRL